MFMVGDKITALEDLKLNGQVYLKKGESDLVVGIAWPKVSLNCLFLDGIQYCVNAWQVKPFQIETNVVPNNVIYVDFKLKKRI
jgi:hypothetical protein